MINHLRTLLLNASGTQSPSFSYPGQEYIPLTYQPFTATADLEAIRLLLFGPNADLASKNYKMRQIMALLHSTELETYVLALDPRVTYWPPHDSYLFRAFDFGAVAEQTAGTSCPISFQGDPNQYTALGAIYQHWSVVLTDSTHALVTRQIDPITSQSVTLVFTSGLSNVIPLAGSDLSVVIGTLGVSLPSWEIIGLARPTYELIDVYQALLGANVEPLFGINEPYTTFRQMWQLDGGSLVYKLSGALLALGYRINEQYLSANPN